MRNGLKNSWYELEDFVWLRCEMLPHFPSRPRGNGPHSFLLALLEKQSRAQWNNCTKYSSAIAMATGPSTSQASARLFRFALDPEKHWVVWCSAPPAQTSRCRWEGRALSSEKEGAESNMLHSDKAANARLEYTWITPNCSRQTTLWDAAEEHSGTVLQSC